MDTQLHVSIIFYPISELHYWMMKGLHKDRTWRAQTHVHLSSGFQIKQIF